MQCRDCGDTISAERLEVFPDAEFCVKCSGRHTKKVVGFLVFGHKTGGELMMVNRNDKEKLRLAVRANRRSR
jgi:RNA polymerase-binding transcription factor DksA